MQNSEIIKYLHKLGFSYEEAEIYLALYEKGPQTPLLISRVTKINRTKVYRTLESMLRKQLVQEEIEANSKRYVAAEIENIKRMLSERQSRLAELGEKFPIISLALSQMRAKDKQDTKVLFYKGPSGVSQMIWNELRAEREIVGYSYRVIETITGDKFANDFFLEFARRNLSMRDLYGEEYIRSTKEGKKKRPEAHDLSTSIKKIHSRFISEKTLEIPLQMDIYNDIVSIYSWQSQEIFGVEIENPKVAKLQRQLFEIAWEKGEEVSA